MDELKTFAPPSRPNSRLPVDVSHIKRITLTPQPALDDYLQAMKLTNRMADRQIGNHMLLSWYDRDRDFESPQHDPAA